MLDFDLAELYQVSTSALNQSVKRNAKRFPPDFMFQITQEEFDSLKSQIVTSSWEARANYRTHSPNRDWPCSREC